MDLNFCYIKRKKLFNSYLFQTQHLLSKKDVETRKFVQDRINTYAEQHPVSYFLIFSKERTCIHLNIEIGQNIRKNLHTGHKTIKQKRINICQIRNR